MFRGAAVVGVAASGTPVQARKGGKSTAMKRFVVLSNLRASDYSLKATTGTEASARSLVEQIVDLALRLVELFRPLLAFDLHRETPPLAFDLHRETLCLGTDAPARDVSCADRVASIL